MEMKSNYNVYIYTFVFVYLLKLISVCKNKRIVSTNTKMNVKQSLYFCVLVWLYFMEIFPSCYCQKQTTANRRQSGRTTQSRQRPKRPTPSRCKPTTSDIYGPYYRPGFPRLHKLCKKDSARNRRHNLIVKGYVYESNCRTRISNVRMEIWQAGSKGRYEGGAQCRGYFKTNNSGYYRFSTVHPGKYRITMAEANAVRRMYNRPIGDRYRPSHIHFKVNGRRGHKSLVSQMYFFGDQHLGVNDSCAFCNSEYSDLWLKPRRVCRKNRCIDVVNFNIILAKGRGISVNRGR